MAKAYIQDFCATDFPSEKPGYSSENTVEPPIVDPPRKGHCVLDLSIKVKVQKITLPTDIENLREEDNLSIKEN